MGNVATKERPRSNSVSYVVYQQQQQQQRSTHNRPRTRSVPDPLIGIASSSRQHRKSKKKREEPQPIIRLTLNLLETVDGGYLQPHGVYSGAHDFEYLLPICTECFVQIQRQPPHYPEEEEDEESGTIEEQSARKQQKQKERGLISEPACCPFCMTPEMGITYTPPRVRTGLASAKAKLLSLVSESTSDSVAIIDDEEDNSGEELAASSASTPPSERRGSLAATDPEVVTTDQIRPDWALKLAAARAYVARKSATASAIHASAFNPRALAEQSDSGSSAGSSSGAGASRRPPRSMVVDVNPRLQELEEMMLMEAIRLSILEEERRASTSAAPTESVSSTASSSARPAGRVRNH
ncbi:hypothetical protein D0Z00_002198 [Geotrichum galactomycetum]|uniref:Uncharacterized protein n=1 Tax=Geotrichum galactomycetum TaxID=27317 RepID=A0ACB6V4W0_9ASCO|nr:hypothetical protein D0Z00_002198 [Geotrichum candidum]